MQTPDTVYNKKFLQEKVQTSDNTQKFKALAIATISGAPYKQIDLRLDNLETKSEEDVFVDILCYNEPLSPSKQNSIFEDYLIDMGNKTTLLN